MTDSFAEDRSFFMVNEHYWVTGTRVAIFDYSDLFVKTLHGDDVQGCDTRWDEVLFVNPTGTLGRYSGKLV